MIIFVIKKQDWESIQENTLQRKRVKIIDEKINTRRPVLEIRNICYFICHAIDNYLVEKLSKWTMFDTNTDVNVADDPEI